MDTKINKDLRDCEVLLILSGPHWIKTPPLSLVYLENFLSSKGIKTRILDLNIFLFKLLNASQKEWLQLNTDFETFLINRIEDQYPDIFNKLVSGILNSNAEILGFSMFDRNRKATLDFASLLSKQDSSKKFVFGGPEILFEYYRDQFFSEFKHAKSYFVIGEGELPLRNLAKNESLEINSFKDKKIIVYEENNNLDNLPFLNFDCLDLNLYPSKILPLFSSRGCIKRCAFCSEYKLYKKFRQHSPSYIIDQIKHLIKKYGINTFSFQDSLINADLKWLDEFCTKIIKNNLEIKWEAQLAIRPEMDTHLFLKMKESGCFNLFVGLESASDKILFRMRKGYNKQHARIFLRKLIDAQLQFEISIITGFPHESENDFLETITFISENKSIIPKIAQANPFVHYAPSDINCVENQELALQRVQRLTEFLKQEKIKFTPAYIKNLIPK